MLLVGRLFILDGLLGLGLYAFDGAVTAIVLGVGIVAGLGYGALAARHMIGRLRDKGVFKPTLKDLFMLGLAAVAIVAGFWLINSAGFIYVRLVILGGLSGLPAARITQALVLRRWELTSGKKVEYDGLWSIKAQPWPDPRSV